MARCRYQHSLDQRVQKLSSIWRMSCRRERREPLNDKSDGSGIVVSELPIRKCPGVNASRSSGSSERGLRGLEFSNVSICIRSVFISSYVRKFSPTTLFKWYFTDLTPASHWPPKCGAAGGLNNHCVPLFASKVAKSPNSFELVEKRF